MRFIEITGAQVPEYKFVCKALSDDETRYFLNFAYCDNGKLIGTDGRRIHILELGVNPHDLKDKKFYRVLKATTKMVWLVELEEDPGTFPNYEKIIPGDDSTKVIEYHSINKRRNDYSQNIGKIMRLFDNGSAVNIKYLDDLPEGNIWEVRFYDNKSGLKFIAGNKTAVMMPMQGDE